MTVGQTSPMPIDLVLGSGKATVKGTEPTTGQGKPKGVFVCNGSANHLDVADSSRTFTNSTVISSHQQSRSPSSHRGSRCYLQIKGAARF